MRILIVPHIGHTSGHMVRANAIAEVLRSLDPATEVLIAANPRVAPWASRTSSFTALPWDWSHHEAGHAGAPSAEYIGRVARSAAAVRDLLLVTRPDVVIGIPGYATVQAALALGIRHVSVLHGPHVAAHVDAPSSADAAAEVWRTSRGVVREMVQYAFDGIAARVGLPRLTVDEFGMSECVIAQPPTPHTETIGTAAGFIRASVGDPIAPAASLEDSCLVTFGTGNPCDLTRVVTPLAMRFEKVIVNTCGTPVAHPLPRNVELHPFVSSASVAERIRLVVCHGGIGTLGAFVPARARVLAIPIELDGACNAAMFEGRWNIAALGLSAWTAPESLTRRLPAFSDDEFHAAVDEVLARPLATPPAPRGADHIALRILGSVGRSAGVTTDARA